MLRRKCFPWSIRRPTKRGFAKDNFKAGSSGGFFYAPSANTRGTNPDVLLDSRYHSAHALQIRIPAATARVVRVADHVAIVRRFSAEFTLQCHSIFLLNLI